MCVRVSVCVYECVYVCVYPDVALSLSLFPRHLTANPQARYDERKNTSGAGHFIVVRLPSVCMNGNIRVRDHSPPRQMLLCPHKHQIACRGDYAHANHDDNAGLCKERDGFSCAVPHQRQALGYLPVNRPL